MVLPLDVQVLALAAGVLLLVIVGAVLGTLAGVAMNRFHRVYNLIR